MLTIGSVACGLLLIAIGITEIVVNLPLLTTVTAALIIAGGLFLTVSSCWARHRQTRASAGRRH